MLIIDTSNQPQPFGPFDVSEFLISPALSRRILPVERFSLRHMRQSVGLDSLDKEQNPRATVMLSSGLQWRGVIYFSDVNRKEISPRGMNLLYQFAGANRRQRELDRGSEFYVDVKGDYYRHSFEVDQESGEIELFVDITQTPGLGKERRFHVTKGSPSFFEDSINSLAQAQVVRAMELVNYKYGKNVLLSSKTVKWYASGYKQLYPRLRRRSESPDASIAHRNSSTILRDIYSALASQLDSRSFCEILTQRKHLISTANLNSYKREVKRVLEHGDEVRGHWGEMMATKRARLLQPNVANTRDMDSQDSTHEDPMQPDPRPSGRRRSQEIPNGNQRVHPNETISHDVIMIDDEGSEGTAVDYEVKIDDDTLFWKGANGSNPIAETRASLSPSADYSRPDQESIKYLRLLPRYMLELPQIPPSCRWHCPAKGCTLLLDLKGQLPIEYLKLLTADEIRFLQQSFWTSRTPIVNDMFRKLVGKHFESHLIESGLRLVDVGCSLSKSRHLQ